MMADTLMLPITSERSLTRQEGHDLAECEKTIELGLETFLEVGQALARIRDSRLYRNRWDSFEQYVKQRWEMSVRHAHRLVDSAEIAQNLLPPAAGVTNWSPPKSESQVRPLKGLEPAEQKEVWDRAVQSAPNGQVTARHVEEVRREFHPKPDAKTIELPILPNAKPQWPKPNVNGVYEKLERPVRWVADGCFAQIDLVQIGPQRWIGSTSYDFRNCASHSPVTANRAFTTREDLIDVLARELISSLTSIQRPDCGAHLSRKHLAAAKSCLGWAQSLIRVLPPVGVTANPIKPAESAAPNVIFERSNITCGELLPKVTDLIDGVVALQASAHGEFSTKAKLHLSIALTHLKNFKNSLDQVQHPKQPTPPQRRIGERINAASRAKWNKAKAKAKNPETAAGERFVISRTAHHSGAVTFRTSGSGWTNNPESAQSFSNATAAKMAARHSYDIPMKLSLARKKARSS